MTSTSLEFCVYSKENIPTQEVAKEISSVFINNYPEIYPEEIRKSDCNRYSTPEKIQEQVQNGNAWIVASTNNKIFGIAKFRLENRHHLINTEEYLLSWIIVDKPHRNKGIAKKILDEYLKILNKIKRNSNNQIFSIADIHKNNLISRKIFKNIGCKEGVGKSPEFILAKKEI